VDKFLEGDFPTGLWKASPQLPHSLKALFESIFAENRGILEYYTKVIKGACAKLLFSTRFSTSCGKVAEKSTEMEI
jgi:hypothetical protein